MTGVQTCALPIYNSKLQTYLTAKGAMNTKAFHTISGADMINKFGYKACPS